MLDNQPCSEPSLKEQFIALLDSELDEQIYQKFMEEHTELIPREFLQNHGLHFKTVLRKLSFSTDYKCDFFYLSKSSDDWNCVLIEIEKPQSRFFKMSNNNLHRDFLAALDQINRWRAWMSDPSNLAHFTKTTLSILRRPLAENPCHIKYVLVLGRRAEYEQSNLRRSLIRSQERDDFKILTFDSLVEDLASKRPLYVAVRKNEHIEFVSEQFVDDSLFGWLSPEQIQINKALRAQLESHKDECRIFKGFGRKNALVEALPKLLDID